MKRFVILALALAFVMSAALANAGELKQKGEIHFTMGWVDNLDFNDNGSEGNQEDDFYAEHRVRHYMEFISSETLKMTLGFEYDSLWGNTVDRGADDNLFELKRAMLDWVVPNTGLAIRMGTQGLALPGAVGGNPIYNDDGPGITASYKFSDMVSATAFWTRMRDFNYGSGDADGGGSDNDELDAAGLILPVSLDGVSFSPFFMYAWIGGDFDNDGDGVYTDDLSFVKPGYAGGEKTTAFWFGTPLTVSAFDPIVFLADFQYGQTNNDNTENMEAAGWRVDAALAYKMDFMTPTVIFNYGSGNDSDANDGFETMPYIATSSDWGPTTMGTDGGHGGTNTGSTEAISESGTGAWAIGFGLESIKLIDGMTNGIRVVYYKGTSDKAQPESYANITEDDSAWEFNLDTKYQLYENLSAGFDFAYVSVDADPDAHGGTDVYPDAASKLLFFLDYSF